jgi:hypothetical protein
LFEATGLFELVKGDNGQMFVADRSNRDRTPAPGGARGESLSDRLPAPILQPQTRR